MLVSLASVAVNSAAAVGMVKWAGFGQAGLAFATSLVSITGATALFVLLRARLGRLGGKTLLASGARTIAASAVMAAVCVASSAAVRHVAPGGRLGHLADVAATVPLGAAVFYLTARILGVRELPGTERLAGIQ
jgi:peptidoglycan biosynthesis protein MviN/MurJ (putative lipid II flippase)